MPSNNPLIRAVKGPIIESVEQARGKIPASLQAGVLSASTALPTTVEGASAAFKTTYAGLVLKATVWLPTTVEPATGTFKSTYGDIVNRTVAWLPSTIPALTKLGNKVADKVVAAIKAA